MVYQSMEDLKRDYELHVEKLFVAMEVHILFLEELDKQVGSRQEFSTIKLKDEKRKYFANAILIEGKDITLPYTSGEYKLFSCISETERGIQRIRKKLLQIDKERLEWGKVEIIKVLTNNRASFTYERPNCSWH